jgi:ABC-2 type transport system ATP-binding protein
MLTGILTPTAGNISVLGHSPQNRERSLKKQIALVMGQKTQLIWDLPAMDTFCFHKDLYQIDAKIWQRTLEELSELLMVTPVLQTPVRQLSLGERMKCEIILALLHHPKVLFLDEPTIGLDIVSQMHLWEFLGTYQKNHNITVLLTSHYVQDIANLCDRVIIINKGKKIFDGLFSDLIERTHPERNGILRFKSQLEAEHLEKLSQLVKARHLERIDQLTYRIRANRPDFSRIASSILKNLPVEELKMEETDLAMVLERSFEMESPS